MTSVVPPRRLLGAGPPFPFVDLFPKPTPLEPIPRFTGALTELAFERHHMGPAMVWIKREDLMAVGLGGNKLRNLEFHVGAALAQGADTLVTAGRGRANHCRLTAAAARRAGLACVLVLSGPEPARPSPNERILELLGVETRYATEPTHESRDTLYAATLSELRLGGRLPYAVPLGASGVVGASGQVLAARELADQLEGTGIHGDIVFVGAATGGTSAGLRVGLDSSITVVAVPTYVSEAAAGGEFGDHLRGLTTDLVAAWGLSPGPEVLLDDLSTWLPYGESSPRARAAARLLAETEGICVEPVYTARTAAAIVAWTMAGRLDGKTVVLWNGGGTPALFEDYGMEMTAVQSVT